MREPDRDPGRLSDILNAANNLAEFTRGVTLEEFLTDKLRYYAVLKNIEIIGEAAYMLLVEYKAHKTRFEHATHWDIGQRWR